MTFQHVALLLTALAVSAASRGSAAAEDARPNILFVFCDDLAFQALSCYQEDRHLLDTPNIDRVATEGMRFDRCLVTNSICGPSRAVIQTGKYSHLNGFYNNSNSRFDSSQTTFPKLLQKGGYTTAVVGKWHLITDPVGYDFWHILPGQGQYYNPPMIDNGKKVQHTGYCSDIITDLSIDWLKNRDKSKPFMLMCQHKAPHREWEPALRHLNWNHDREFAEPKTLFDNYTGRSKAIHDHDMGIDRTFTERDAKLVAPKSLNAEQLKEWNAYYEPRNEKYRAANLTGQDLVRWRYQRYMHDYLGCVKAVDEGVGRLLGALEDEGIADNTVVMVTSDQGFYLGEHGWFDKRWIFEESLRSPLVIRWPGVTKPGSVDNHIVSLLDFAETFLDLAGQEVPAEMQGKSLVPILKGDDPADWRKSLYYHYYEYPVPHRVRPHYGVITDRYKLIHYYKPDVDDWDLLDRQKDPLEVTNFYNDPEYADIRKQLHAELERVKAEAKDTEETPRKAFGNRPFDNEPAATAPQPRRPQNQNRRKANQQTK
ncbi:MAG: sulfatase [Planctomycetaceae bacterium]